MFFMGEKRLAKIPVSDDEHQVFMLSIKFRRLPEEIRAMPFDDRSWLQLYLVAIDEAEKELKRRPQP